MGFDPKTAGRRNKGRHKHPYRFGPHDIARATGKSMATVRRDRKRDLFDPTDLLSLAHYVVTK